MVVFKTDSIVNESTKATYQEVLAGEFLINPINLNYDLKSLRTGLSEIDTCVSPAYIVLQSKLAANKNYLKYQLHLFDVFHMKTLGAGVRQTITFGDIGACLTILPPLAEQTRIAAFLDRETTKIDGLIAEQQGLIDLLKEKRQAVISHAVTKGLNPQAPMKPSGIELLGDVPAHWRVGKCGFYINILSGFAFPSSDFTMNENATKLLRGINVGVAQLKWDEVVYWNRKPGDGLDVYEMRTGDVVIGMDRPLISEGMRVAKVEESDLPCLLLQRVASLKSRGELHSDYLMALLASDMFVAHFAPETTGVSVPHISPEQINTFDIPVPPLVEQNAIVSLIATETGKVKSLTVEAEHAIALLTERRTALISAAVTGQIDVRHLAEANAA